MRALALALCMVATPAMAADQFDLICTGGANPVRYRVDLAKGEACSDSCDQVWKMGPATTGQLKIIDRAPAYRGDLEERLSVNRHTGAWTYFMSLSGRVSEKSGTCELAPFSGFPAAKF